MTPVEQPRERRWAFPVFLVALAVLFMAAMVFFALRDNAAVDRCHEMGGQTWDSGEHCVIGDYRIVDTHDRIGL